MTQNFRTPGARKIHSTIERLQQEMPSTTWTVGSYMGLTAFKCDSFPYLQLVEGATEDFFVATKSGDRLTMEFPLDRAISLLKTEFVKADGFESEVQDVTVRDLLDYIQQKVPTTDQVLLAARGITDEPVDDLIEKRSQMVRLAAGILEIATSLVIKKRNA